MASIPQSEIDRLNAEVPVVPLVGATEIGRNEQDGKLVAACPLHKDAAPTLVVDPMQNHFCCTKCGFEGGPVDWVMKVNGISLRHAVELLCEGIPGVTNEAVKRSTVRALSLPVSPDADDQTLLDQAIGYYHETLKRSPEALAYLARRGLASSAAVEQFKLGFANRTLGLRLPDKQRKEGAAIRARLARVGIYRETGHEQFNGALVIPVLDVGGHVTQVYGRKITDGLRTGTALHLWLPGPQKGLWNIEGIKAGGGEVILCKGVIDAMTFWCAGYQNVTACAGPDNLSGDHLAALKAYGVKQMPIAFGSERATAAMAERLTAEGFGCYGIGFPWGLDPNSYALKFTPASKAFGILIRKAEWLGTGEPLGAPTTMAVMDAAYAASPDGVREVLAHEVAASPGKMVVQDDDDGGDEADSETLDAKMPSADIAPALPLKVQTKVSSAEHEVVIGKNEVTIPIGDRTYRVRGHERNLAIDVMRVNVLARHGDLFHVDTFDLYSAKARTNFVQMATGELRLGPDVVKADLGKVLFKMEGLQEQRIREALTPSPLPHEVAPGDQEAALKLLRSPDLMDRIVADLEACGLVGETTNKLVAYLATISRKLANPLAVLVQSSSAAGKTSLMDAILAFVPEEDRAHYSSLTGQALYYMGQTSLKHHVLAIAEDEGAVRASYALKLLQSEGEITIASTAKDADSGILVTKEYRVEGPVMLFLTTTAISIDEEMLNRCIVLSVDEGRVQTESIHRLQRHRRTLAGLMERSAKDDLVKLHQNAQRLLRPLAVVNTFADRLGFLSDRTRTRRDHEKYLTLIDTIAFLHQHQREILTVTLGGKDIEYVEVTLRDIETANRLTHEVLGGSLDCLPPQTRNLLGAVTALVDDRMRTEHRARTDVRFSRRELREATHVSNTQLKVHLRRLVELEYLVVHRAERGKMHAYELAYDGDGSESPHLSGLIDVSALTNSAYDGERSGLTADRSGSGRASVGPWSGAGPASEFAEKLAGLNSSGVSARNGAGTHVTAPVVSVNRTAVPIVPAASTSPSPLPGK